MYSQIFSLHAKLLKALAHPRRLEIIHLLRDQELVVTDIYSMLDLPQANVSQHLMILRDANIVRHEKKGKEVYYSLANKKIIKASDLLRDVLIDQHKDTDLADEFSMKMKDLVPLVHDPVCDMRVSPKTAAFAHTHKGREYFFCASGCASVFEKNPEKFIQK